MPSQRTAQSEAPPSRFRGAAHRSRPHIVFEGDRWHVLPGCTEAIGWGEISRQLGHDEQAERWCRDANAA